MTLGVFAPVFSITAAASEERRQEVNEMVRRAQAMTRTEEVRAIMGALQYPEYRFEHRNSPMGTGPDRPVVIKPSDYIPELSSENVRIVSNDETQGRTALFSPEDGMVSFEFNVEQAGLYNLCITYLQIVGKNSAIERSLMINGRIPFREARHITLVKTYRDDFTYRGDHPGGLRDDDGKLMFRRDIMDNEIRPPMAEAPEWRTVLAEDSSGFVEEPFLFYLEEGPNIITFDAVREAFYIEEIKFYVKPALPTYEEYRASFPNVKGTGEIALIQAQFPVATSEIIIYAVNDRTSALTQPQDASRIRLNSIGGGGGQARWQDYGQWIRYEFYVPQGGAGFYHIVPRFKQATFSGVYSSRRIRIGPKGGQLEVPFQEANRLRFNYADRWQVIPLNDGTTIGEGRNAKLRHFEFYFTEGWHEIEFEVVLGDMAELLGKVQDSVAHLNEMHRKIRMITGATPDNYRDYSFGKQIPTVLEGMRDESVNLYEISEALEDIIGARGEQTVLLNNIAFQLHNMAYDNDRIAPGLARFYSNIGGLSAWLLQRRNQPLELDYIKIHRIDDPLPRAEASFWQAAMFEIRSFIMSFFADYNNQGMMIEITRDSNMVEVWRSDGREQAQITRQMVIDFTAQTDIAVNMKLVAPGTLLPSVLAGVGPDVSLDGGSAAVVGSVTDAINLAIRSAVLPLNYDRDGNRVSYSLADPARGIHSFEELRGIGNYTGTGPFGTGWFSEAAWVPLTLQDNRIYNSYTGVGDPDKLMVFGLPNTQTFPMLFYRQDILVDLGIEVPRTWEEMYDIVPLMQIDNLNIGIAPGMGPLTWLMYQQNIPLYKGDGIESNLDDNLAISAFREMTQLYTLFKFQTEFDFPNRFRDGTFPIGVAGYDLYNHLTVFAPEIRGIWEFVPMIGTVRPEMREDAGIDYGHVWRCPAPLCGRQMFGLLEPEPCVSREHHPGEQLRFERQYDEYGNRLILDNSVVPITTSIMMMRSAAARNNTDNAWAFMQWWVGEYAQGVFGNEQVAIMGPAAKYPTANLAALANMPWPTADFRALNEQFQRLKGIPQVPGSYLLDREITFSWETVVNDGASAVDTLLDRIPIINAELTRKRKEFGMPVIERDRFGRRLDREQPADNITPP
jgi:hypothetical protein